MDWDAVAHSYRARLKGTPGIPSRHQTDVGDNHIQASFQVIAREIAKKGF
jgi:hypothetical protein